MLLETIFFAIGAAGLISAALDSYSTYKGVFVLKVATEGNPSAMAKFLTSNKFICLLGKPLAMTAILVASYFGGSVCQVAGIIAAAGATVVGLAGFKNNLAVNGGF
jgi:hypothetical protein